MKHYGVKELAKISGISVRTLHHYDKIGLLKPLKRSEAGYRFYGEVELLRLQQILFYKELDFPLKEIQEVLNDEDFDLVNALEKHKVALRNRQERISKLLETIDHTIHHLKHEQETFNPEMLYEGLPKELGTTYRNGAIEKYGKRTVQKAEKALVKLGKEGFQQLQKEFEHISKSLFELREMAPESYRVQQLIRQHYTIIRTFWGTSQMVNKQAEEYAGLGELYLDDERYTQIDGKVYPEFASFMQQAMKYFAYRELKG